MSTLIKIKLLTESARMPKYESYEAAGFDLVADNFQAIYTEHPNSPFDCSSSKEITLHPGQRLQVGTGLAMEIPFGFEVQIRPRSGVSLKRGLLVVLGTIDSDYRGEVGVILINTSLVPENVVIGERIAQAVLAINTKAAFTEAKVLNPSIRGESGFGSTGDKMKISEQY